MKEVQEKHYAGPFERIPYEYYIQSPIGLVPKDGRSSTHLIFYLSYPRSKGTSVNAQTPKDMCSVKYPDFAAAIKRCLEEGRFCFIAKSDMKSAFRNLGIKPEQFGYLVMVAQSPLDNKWYFFIDKCLAFEVSISCLHFQCFSNSIAHILQHRTKRHPVNYMDDFFFIAIMKKLL